MSRLLAAALAFVSLLPMTASAQVRPPPRPVSGPAPVVQRPIAPALGDTRLTAPTTPTPLAPAAASPQASQVGPAAEAPAAQQVDRQVEPPPPPPPEPPPTEWGCNDGNIAGAPDTCGDGGPAAAAASEESEGPESWLLFAALGLFAAWAGWKLFRR